MKNSIIIQRAILAVSFTLIGCQSQTKSANQTQLLSNFEITVSATNIGNITAATPFSVHAIREAFPGYNIMQKMHSVEGEMYPVILVIQGNETLLIVNSGVHKVGIHSVIVASPKVNSYRGYTVGMQYNQILTDIVPIHCSPGLEELSGMVICPAKSANTITYIFAGHWSGPDGELPPQQILNAWRLYQLVWSAVNIGALNNNPGDMHNEN